MYEPNNEQIQAVIQLDTLQEVIAETYELINDPEIETKISAWDLFCQKTGHRIGSRSENSLLLLIKICGKTGVESNLYNCTSLNVHPAWLDTSPDCLDDLMESDPIGYACYSFAFLTMQFYQRAKNQDVRLYPASERYWALARANALMQERGTHELDELCAELARAVTFMPDSGVHLFNAISKFGNTPDKLAALHCSGELISKLRDATNLTMSSLGQARTFAKHWIQRTRFIDLAATPEDAARGPSNIRKQRISKRHVADAAMFNEIDKLFANQGFDLKQQILDNTPGSTAWREKISEASRRRQAEIELGLAALDGLTNLTFFDENDDDDQTVEVRSIAREPEGNDKEISSNANSDESSENAEVAFDLENTNRNMPADMAMIDTANISKAMLVEIGQIEARGIPVISETTQPKLSALQILRAKKGV